MWKTHFHRPFIDSTNICDPNPSIMGLRQPQTLLKYHARYYTAEGKLIFIIHSMIQLVYLPMIMPVWVSVTYKDHKAACKETKYDIL